MSRPGGCRDALPRSDTTLGLRFLENAVRLAPGANRIMTPESGPGLSIERFAKALRTIEALLAFPNSK